MVFIPGYNVANNGIYIITLAVIASCSCANVLIDDNLPILPTSLVENHIVKVTKEGILDITLPTLESKIDYDVGETVSWTVLIDTTDYIHPLFNLQWIKNGYPIESENFNDTDGEIKTEIVNNTDHQITLNVRNLSKSDEGVYQLSVIIDADGNQQTKINFTLRIRDEPSYFVINTTSTVNENQLGLVCWIYSRPPIIGFTLPGHNQSLLSPKNWREIFHYDQESYKNASLNEEAVMTIFVQPAVMKASDDQPKKNITKSPRRVLSHKHIEQFQLSCTTSNTNTNQTKKLNWSLRFPNDSHVNLNDSSYIPQGLKMMSLPCIVFGLHHQPCSFIQMLIWRNVSKATEGIYSVTTAFEDSTFLSEGAETKTASLAFQIQASTKPHIFNSSESMVIVKEGEVASLFCQSNGSPLPFTTQWIKDGSLITNSSTYLMTSLRTELLVESILIISATNLTDMGTYKCLFDNPAGVTEKDINLQIIPTDEEMKQNEIDKDVVKI